MLQPELRLFVATVWTVCSHWRGPLCGVDCLHSGVGLLPLAKRGQDTILSQRDFTRFVREAGVQRQHTQTQYFTICHSERVLPNTSLWQVTSEESRFLPNRELLKLAYSVSSVFHLTSG